MSKSNSHANLLRNTCKLERNNNSLATRQKSACTKKERNNLELYILKFITQNKHTTIPIENIKRINEMSVCICKKN